MLIRDAVHHDLPRLLEINNQNTPSVNELDDAQMLALFGECSVVLAAELDDHVAGFCMVLPPGTAYWSGNYRWFCERYDSFIYLDRVAVAEGFRSRGVGAALYAEVERRAPQDADLFALEVNLEPRNDGSLRFHAREGFVEVGQNRTDYGFVVSMLTKPLR